jgi:hypothetical protein
MAAHKPVPLPALVSRPVAARLLGFDPPSGFGRHAAEHPKMFPNSTERLFAMADINAHPRRGGRAVSPGEYLRIDNLLAEQRAYWRDKNARRAAGTLIEGRGRWQQGKKSGGFDVV